MKSDSSLYEIFHAHPEWIADLMNDPFPEPCTFTAPVIKSSERRMDGLITPENAAKPLLVVEFQFVPSDDIYLRITEQRLAMLRQNPGREVESVVFFASNKLDKRLQPWCNFSQAIYLDKEMAVLAQRVPNHPLPKLLQPLFEKNDATLEASAPVVYNDLGRAPGFSKSQRQTLQTFYTSLILNRFKHRNLENIKAMLSSLDITKTRAGRELIAIGKAEGVAEGEAKGRTEGLTEGLAGSLIKMLERRLGKLSKATVTQIGKMDYLKLEALGDHVLDVENQMALRTLLREIQSRP